MWPALKSPEGWNRGELLDVKRFTDGTFTITPLYAGARKDELRFANGSDCQQFVSWWYAPQGVQEQERPDPALIRSPGEDPGTVVPQFDTVSRPVGKRGRKTQTVPRQSLDTGDSQTTHKNILAR